MSKYLCVTCGKNHVFAMREQCSECDYESLYHWMREQPQDEQDWEFSICEECGGSLDSKGHCRNTSCGNSPYLGTDWE
jgi:hypothetical protein